ncbi:hypothetical protein BCR44DRAFT_239782 [Catenaria anguillulae PL171]|uniref:Uncharacterized protein n=1 Tax=Catenaria anguillulae PL171 TaxID=765915 RepID=A0A1Y2H5P7_9FUNG|nr:hypothetical protein BCR44DRAFT_239782 [Catenaria anguillulae PL171]
MLLMHATWHFKAGPALKYHIWVWTDWTMAADSLWRRRPIWILIHRKTNLLYSTWPAKMQNWRCWTLLLSLWVAAARLERVGGSSGCVHTPHDSVRVVAIWQCIYTFPCVHTCACQATTCFSVPTIRVFGLCLGKRLDLARPFLFTHCSRFSSGPRHIVDVVVRNGATASCLSCIVCLVIPPARFVAACRRACQSWARAGERMCIPGRPVSEGRFTPHGMPVAWNT